MFTIFTTNIYCGPFRHKVSFLYHGQNKTRISAEAYLTYERYANMVTFRLDTLKNTVVCLVEALFVVVW